MCAASISTQIPLPPLSQTDFTSKIRWSNCSNNWQWFINEEENIRSEELGKDYRITADYQ